MLLKNLLDMQLNGVLNIKYNKGDTVANLGGVAITLEQGATICGQLGWVEYRLSPFEIIEKTNKFVKSLKTYMTRADIWEGADISFQNIASMSYGKTFDRIMLNCPGVCNLTIIYNMENSGAKYCVYETGRALPVCKCANLKKVSEFINTYDL